MSSYRRSLDRYRRKGSGRFRRLSEKYAEAVHAGNDSDSGSNSKLYFMALTPTRCSCGSIPSAVQCHMHKLISRLATLLMGFPILRAVGRSRHISSASQLFSASPNGTNAITRSTLTLRPYVTNDRHPWALRGGRRRGHLRARTPNERCGTTLRHRGGAAGDCICQA